MGAVAGLGLGRRLMQFGFVLFLLGLLTGFAVPVVANPRMALSSHLEGVINGIVLVVIGLTWAKLRLGTGARRTAFGMAVYGAYVNWATTLAAACWAAGGAMMPFAAGDLRGTSVQEGLIAFGLISLSVAMVVVTGILIWGLRGNESPDAP